MSDRPRGGYQGRGGGGGRGGYRGDRGGGDRGRGGGGYRGDRGGGGGYRGDRGGGDRGRGGGEFRGRGGGEFRGRGGGDRGRGGGGYRGGGDGARFDKFAGEPAVFREGSVPIPDERITALENSALAALHRMLKSAAEGQSPTGHPMPPRPGFGANGKETILWTNYFPLRVTDARIHKYTMSVEKIPKAPGPEEGEAGSSKQPAKDPPKKSATAAAKSADDKVSSRKQEEVVRAVLRDLLPRETFATELKSQIFTIKPLDLPEDKTIVHRHGPLGRQESFRVRFDGPFSVPLEELLRYLNQMYDPSGDVSFPKFEDVRDALSVVLGSYARMDLATAAAGRSRFFPLNIISEVFKLGVEGNKLLRGVFGSVRLATGRLLLNVNVSHGVFRPHGPLPDVFEELNPGLNEKNWADVSFMIQRLRVRMKVLPEPGAPKNLTHDTVEKTITSLAISIDGCTDNPKPVIKYRGSGPANIYFWISAPAPHGFTPGQITVKEYYRKRYQYIANDSLPCANVGSVQKPVFVPAELLEVIPGQLLRRKTTPNETADMIKVACRSPYANAQSLMKQGRQILKLDGNEDLARFGVSVGKELLTVKGRELPPPGIVYSGGKIVNIFNGGWNMRDVGVYKSGKPLNNWTYVSFGLNNAFGEIDEVMGKFVDFQKRSMGIAISGQARGPESLPHGGNGIRTLKDILKKHQRNNQLPDYIFFILPKQDSFLYNEVKTVCDVEFGIHSTCMVWGNLRKSNPQFFANVALKVNLKLGGVNHYLRTEIPALASGKTMVVGYDVTHPTNVAGDADKMPSLVGIVASVDKYLGQWPATAWSQKGKVEMLDQNLEDAFKRHLKIWQARNGGQYPGSIIVFRDGVSEGQFQQVLEKELPFMRSACASLYPGGKGPRFSIIVSVKRHQTRFYPGDPQKITSSRNVLPGTVVDRGVTQANVWDFFLTAHSALQGTARPAHYTVLLDECFRASAGLNAANSLEALTHEMCYLFGRATKAVSICPPAYYADILCTRQRAYMDDVFSSGGRNSGPTLSENDHTSIIGRRVHEKIRDSMYYI